MGSTPLTAPPSTRTPQLLRPITVVLAHDTRSRACDMVVDRVAAHLVGTGSRPCHVEEAGSLEAAWVALDRARKMRALEEVLVLPCLDLPPAPRGGVTVAGWARSLRLPAIMITHGRRWLPADASTAPIEILSPMADAAEVARILGLVIHPSSDGASIEAAPESFPGRPSWLG